MIVSVLAKEGLVAQQASQADEIVVYEEKDDAIRKIGTVECLKLNPEELWSVLDEYRSDAVLCGKLEGRLAELAVESPIQVYAGCRGVANQAVQDLVDHVLFYDPAGSEKAPVPREGNQDGEENPIITLTVTDEHGREQDSEFRMIAVYSCGSNQYVALTPDLDAPELEADIYLFRYFEDGDACTVEEILDDEEFAAAADAFQQWQLSRG